MERRFFDVQELRVGANEDDEQRTIFGYAAVFDMLSQVIWGFREKIAHGAFAESLANGYDIRALWNHDTNFPLGRTVNKTLRLAEDHHGLHTEIDPPASTMADGFVASIDRGDVSQMSFGFRTLEDTWDEDDEGQIVRTLLKVRLFEVSPVTFPAYPDTAVSVRSEEGLRSLIPIYGERVEIPANLRRAMGEAGQADEAMARARVAYRRRQLEVVEFV